MADHLISHFRKAMGCCHALSTFEGFVQRHLLLPQQLSSLLCKKVAEAEQQVCAFTDMPLSQEQALMGQLVQTVANLTAAYVAPLPGSLSALLLEALFPGYAVQPLADIIVTLSFAKIEILYRAFFAAAEFLLSDVTCFSLLSLAYRSNCQHLWIAAKQQCCVHFSTAFQRDVAGLAALPLPVMKHLFRLDDIQVFNEWTVFEGLAVWINGDLQNRHKLLPGLLGSVVRMGDMGSNELVKLDCHPLISSCRPCIQVVAKAYINMLTNDRQRPRYRSRKQPMYAMSPASPLSPAITMERLQALGIAPA